MKIISLKAMTILLLSILVFYSCSSNNAQSTQPGEETTEANTATASTESKIQVADVTLSSPLNATWISAGKGVYELKCQSCHKLTDEKLVGPGWKGITQRRSAGWIIAMITNTDEMLNQDTEAQKLLEQCLVRMPNQNVSQEDARKVVEFMRDNDGVK